MRIPGCCPTCLGMGDREGICPIEWNNAFSIPHKQSLLNRSVVYKSLSLKLHFDQNKECLTIAPYDETKEILTYLGSVWAIWVDFRLASQPRVVDQTLCWLGIGAKCRLG